MAARCYARQLFGRSAALLLASLVTAAGGAAAIAQQTDAADPAATSCAPEPGEAQSVARVIDGETIQLTDGREVRLIGALAPRAFDAGVAAADWPAEREAREALGALVAGASVSLAQAGRQVDRYGRQLAQVFVERRGERVWVQAAMIEGGNARAYGLPGSFDCLPELAAREASARAGGLGLWRNPAYAVRRADAARDVLRLRNTYQIVEGTVAAVANVRGHIYLNFGANWRDDFTAGISTARADRAWLDEVRRLAGRRIRVRGWIERHNGPFVAVADRAQIELLDGDPPIAGQAAEAASTATHPVDVPAPR